MSRITIKDIAKKLNLSISTVSRALNNHPAISEETVSSVKQLAKELKYRPNLRAKSLQSSQSKIIALIIPEINMFFVPELIYGINTSAQEKGYSVMVFQSDNQLSKESDLLNYVINLPVDGILISISEETKTLEHLFEAQHYGIPLVFVDKISSDDRFSSITIDDEKATEEAASFLVNKGHSTILGIFGNPALAMTQQRKSSFLRSVLDLIPLARVSILEIDQVLELDEMMEDALSKNPEITAIFAMSDELLVGIHHHLMKSGLSIPNDISLIAISDGFVPYYLYPNIAHIHHSGFEVGIKATELLINRIKHPEHESVHVKIKTKLFEMDSVKNMKSENSESV